ncbi:MAG: ribosome maturation factor RimM [Janthinobacterium lividum]
MLKADDRWLPAAQLLRPQGRHGELLAEPHADLSVFSTGRRLWLAPRENSVPLPSAERVLEAAWQPTGRNAGRTVLKLQGVDSISAAEALAGQFVLLRAADLPPLEEDTFRVRDLVGCALFDQEKLAGTVVDIQFPVGADGRTRLTDAPDLLAVQPAGDLNEPDNERDPVLVPFVRSWLTGVDLVAKRITMHLPPGLFDTLDEV